MEYRLPSHASSVSPEALDLLQHILVENPAHRYSLTDVQAHPWCGIVELMLCSMENACMLINFRLRPGFRGGCPLRSQL